MKIKTLDLDTDSPEAQEAKRLAIAVQDAFAIASKDDLIKANVQPVYAAQRQMNGHWYRTGWAYYEPVSRNREPYWIYHTASGEEVRIYDREDQT